MSTLFHIFLGWPCTNRKCWLTFRRQLCWGLKAKSHNLQAGWFTCAIGPKLHTLGMVIPPLMAHPYNGYVHTLLYGWDKTSATMLRQHCSLVVGRPIWIMLSLDPLRLKNWPTWRPMNLTTHMKPGTGHPHQKVEQHCSSPTLVMSTRRRSTKSTSCPQESSDSQNKGYTPWALKWAETHKETHISTIDFQGRKCQFQGGEKKTYITSRVNGWGS